jgi:hypothetical protein
MTKMDLTVMATTESLKKEVNMLQFLAISLFNLIVLYVHVFYLYIVNYVKYYVRHDEYVSPAPALSRVSHVNYEGDDESCMRCGDCNCDYNCSALRDCLMARHYKARDKAKVPYDYHRCDIDVSVHDRQSYDIVYSSNKRLLSYIRGRTKITLKDGRQLYLEYPLIGVSYANAVSFLHNFCPDSLSFKRFKTLNVDTKPNIAALLMGSFLFDYKMNKYVFYGFVVPLIEESIKWFFPILFPVIEFIEKCIYNNGHGGLAINFIVCLFPLMMHLCTVQFENVLVRMLIHCCWNLFWTHLGKLYMGGIFYFYRDDVTSGSLYYYSEVVEDAVPGRVIVSIEESEASRVAPLDINAYEIIGKRFDRWFAENTTASEIMADQTYVLNHQPNPEGHKLDDFLNIIESDFVVEISKLYALCNALLSKDVKAFIALMISFKYVSKFMNLINSYQDIFTIENFENIISEWFASIYEVPVYTGDEVPKVDGSSILFKIFGKLMAVFPKEISASPTIKHIFTMIMTVLGALFFRDFTVFKNAFSTVDFISINPANIVDSCLGILDGFICAFKSGQWKDFFKDPEQVKLRKDLDDFLQIDCCLLTELLEGVDKAKALLTRVQYSSDPYVMKMSIHLLTRIKEYKQAIDDCKTRQTPIIVWLVGSAGSGKTTGKDTIIQAFGHNRGREVDPNLIGEMDLNVKHPAEKVNARSEVLIINELRADFSQDLVNNFIPTEIYFQRFADTAGLKVSQASVAAKGISYNKVELIIIMSNPFNYLFGSDILKLKRRFKEHFVMLNQELVEFDNDTRTFKILENTSVQDVRQYIHYRMLRPVINDKYLSLQVDPLSDWISVPRMIKFLMARVKTHDDYAKGLFKALGTMCPCGMNAGAHFEGKVWVSLSDECLPVAFTDYIKPETCDCGVSVTHHSDVFDAIHWSDSPYRIKKIRENTYRGTCREVSDFIPPTPRERAVEEVIKSNALAAAVDRRRKKVNTSLTVTIDTEYFYYTFYVMILGVLYYVYNNYLKSKVESLKTTYQKLARFANYVESNQFKQSAKTFGVVVGKVECAYENLTEFEEKYKSSVTYFLNAMKFLVPSAIMLMGARMAWSYYTKDRDHKRFQDVDANFTAGPIFRENLKAGTMQMNSITTEVCYPEELRVKWNKAAGAVISKAVFSQTIQNQHLTDKVNACNYRFEMSFHDKKKPCRKGWLLKISEQYCLINAHYLKEIEGVDAIYVSILSKEDKVLKTFNIGSVDIVQIYHDKIKTDVCLIRAETLLSGSNLIGHFLDDRGSVKQLFGQVPMSIEPEQAVFHIAEEEYFGIGECWSKKGTAPDGECGLAAVGHLTGTSVLLGVVCYRDPAKDGCRQGGNVLYRGDILRAIASFETPFVNSIDVPAKTYTNLAVNSSFRELDKQHMLPIGSVGTHGSSFGSKLEQSMCYHITEPLCSQRFSIPRNPKALVDGVWYSTYTHTFASLPQNEIYNPNKLEESVTAISDYFRMSIEEKFPNIKLSPLTLEEAFFGDERQMLDRCNFKSVIGPTKVGVARTRSDFFNETEAGIEFNDEFKTKFQVFHDEVLQGFLEAIEVSAAIKDEIRPTSKVELANLRLFYTVGIYWNTLCKMYLGPIRAFLLRIPEISKCFGQINSSSIQWDELAKYLKFDDLTWKIIDEDFSKFDVCHRTLIKHVALLFYKLGLYLYKDKDAASMAYYCIYILLVQLFKHGCDIALKTAGMPSGYDATLIINSMVNLILSVYCWTCLIVEKKAIDYFEFVKAATVGDDNVSAVHALYANRFNVLTMEPFLVALGYKVTNGNKSASLSAFIKREDVRFLKRCFRYDQEIKRYMPAIEEDTIWKMLSFWENKGVTGVPQPQIISDNLEVAQREFFFFGREVFADRQVILKEIAKECDLNPVWFDYEKLKASFIANDFQMNWI